MEERTFSPSLFWEPMLSRVGCVWEHSRSRRKLSTPHALVMLAAKFHDDLYYSNAYYAKVGGLQVKEAVKGPKGQQLEIAAAKAAYPE